LWRSTRACCIPRGGLANNRAVQQGAAPDERRTARGGGAVGAPQAEAVYRESLALRRDAGLLAEARAIFENLHARLPQIPLYRERLESLERLLDVTPAPASGAPPISSP
jgi:hypothetical protein